jgi:hypothetical protein
MTKPTDIIYKEPCSKCSHQDVDVKAMEVREKLREAGRKRQMLTTPKERARNVAKSQKTKKFHKRQKERHEALGLPYVKGQTVVTDDDWKAAWKPGSKFAELQHPSA